MMRHFWEQDDFLGWVVDPQVRDLSNTPRSPAAVEGTSPIGGGADDRVEAEQHPIVVTQRRADAPTYGKGMGWSGKKLGRKRYNKMMRHWHAAPAELKLAVGGPLLAGATLADWYASHSGEGSGE